MQKAIRCLILSGRTCVCLVFTVLVFFGCSSTNSMNPDAIDTGKEKVHSTDIVESDSGKLLEIETGGEFQVSLEANGTAGFQWMTKALDESMLEVVDKRFVLHNKDKVGSAGLAITRYKTLKAGSMTLQLQLCRPWECEKTTVKTFDLEISIADPVLEAK